MIDVYKRQGIMGAKKNSELIPLCHIIALTDCEISFELDEMHRQIKATCKTSCIGKTGVEMEAMTGVSVALLLSLIHIFFIRKKELMTNLLRKFLINIRY